MSKWLIVGLGNIGEEYEYTRHNIGFNVIDAFVQRHEEKFSPNKLGDTATVNWKGKIFICLKPATYMNLSGKAVLYWMQKEQIERHQILIIVDDLALPLSILKLRPGGGDAGHNGLKSIQEHLQTQQYPKLRFGIGNDFPKGKQVNFVLGKWTPTEIPIVEKKIETSIHIIESLAIIGIEKTMNLYNKQHFTVT